MFSGKVVMKNNEIIHNIKYEIINRYINRVKLF